VLIHAQGLNITVLSYADELQYGLLSTPEIAPDVQQLADLIGKEFRIIQAAVRRLEKNKAADPAPPAIHSREKALKKKAPRKKVARKPK
jgi:hypothetical protein